MEKLNLTQEWDKVFPKSDKVDHKKVTFHNRYGITLAADMYMPKSVEGKLPAITVSGPFGAVKEQSSGLYAQKMAELGFLTRRVRPPKLALSKASIAAEAPGSSISTKPKPRARPVSRSLTSFTETTGP